MLPVSPLQQHELDSSSAQIDFTPRNFELIFNKLNVTITSLQALSSDYITLRTDFQIVQTDFWNLQVEHDEMKLKLLDPLPDPTVTVVHKKRASTYLIEKGEEDGEIQSV